MTLYREGSERGFLMPSKWTGDLPGVTLRKFSIRLYKLFVEKVISWDAGISNFSNLPMGKFKC